MLPANTADAWAYQTSLKDFGTFTHNQYPPVKLFWSFFNFNETFDDDVQKRPQSGCSAIVSDIPTWRVLTLWLGEWKNEIKSWTNKTRTHILWQHDAFVFVVLCVIQQEGMRNSDPTTVWPQKEVTQQSGNTIEHGYNKPAETGLTLFIISFGWFAFSPFPSKSCCISKK